MLLDEELLAPEDVCRRLKIAITTLYSWRYERKGPPSIKVGGRIRYKRSDLERWLEDISAKEELRV